jgi:peptidoglycan/LPS O-acetylase OafA/YrhL
LYLVHYPMLAMVAAILMKGRFWQPTPRHIAIGAGIAAVAVVYGYGVAACTEWHNDRVRRWVQDRLESRNRAHESLALR